MFSRSIQQSRIPTKLNTAPLASRRQLTQTHHRFDEQKPVTNNYNAPPAPRSRTSDSQLPFLPLVAIFCLGSGSFYWLAKSREGSGSSHYTLPDRAPSKQQWPKTKQEDD